MCEFRHISSSSIPVKFRRKLVEQLQWCSSIIYIYISVNVLGPFICGPASNFWGTTTEKVLTASFHPMIYTRTLYYVELQKISGIDVFYAGIVADNTFLLVVACTYDLLCSVSLLLCTFLTLVASFLVWVDRFFGVFFITEISRGQGLEVQIQKDVSVSNCHFLQL